jgi:hypothetical protein
MPVFAAGITATKTDSWDDTVIPNGKAEPGQVVTYTVTINNGPAEAATGVTFNDQIDPNTTLVAGSVQTQPVAQADAYPVLGNVRIQVTDPAQGLLANDIDPDTGNNTVLTATGPATTTNGGQITINSDGTFTYNPPAGFEGTGASADKVTYTVTDKGPDNTAGTADDKTDTAVASFDVSGMIWFVNSAAVSNGDGRLTSPFNCLRGPQCFDSTTTGGAADGPNDNIFLYSGSYAGGLTLLAGQKLIGQGASTTLAGVAGVTVPAHSDPLPALNSNPSSVTITTSVAATNGVNLPATGAETLRGFTIGNTTGFDVASGATFGTLNASEVVLNGTGGALNLNTGALSATFGGVTSTASAAQGMALQSVTGSLTAGGTAISGSTTQGILVSGSTANIDFGNTSVGTASAGSGGTNGISLQNNSGGTRTFGTLTIQNNSGANSALLIGGGGNSGGSVTAGTTNISGVPASGNNIDIRNLAAGATVSFGATTVNKASAGALVNMANDAGSITFASLTGANTAGNGVVGTDDTGALTVTSGTGSISATGGAALSLNNASGNQPIDLDFTALTTTDSPVNALLLKNVGGTGLSLPNAITFDMAAGAAENIKIQNSTAATIRIGTNGTTHNAVNLNDRRSTGVLIDTAGGTIQFGTSTIPNPNNAGGYGIRVQSSSAAVTFPSATIANANVTSAQTDAGDGTPGNDGDGDAIFLKSNTGPFTLSGGTLSNCGNDCLDLRDSTALTVSGVTVQSPGVDTPGTGTGVGGNGFQLINLTGTNSISGTTFNPFTAAGHAGIYFFNKGGGTSTVTVQGVTFSSFTGNGSVGINVLTQGTSTTNFTVGGPTNSASTNCTFTNVDGSAINYSTTGTATLNATLQRSTFQNAATDSKTNVTGGHIQGSHVSYNVLNNTFNNVMLTASTGEGLLSFSADATAAGNSFAMNMTGNTISNVGSSATNCGGGAARCLGPIEAILIFIDNNSNVPGTIVVDGNSVTNSQQGGMLLDINNTGADAGTGVAAKIINNVFGTDAAPVGVNSSPTTSYGIRVERRTHNGPPANVLINNNSIRNGSATCGGTCATSLNGAGIHIRTKANDSMSATVTNNNVTTFTSGHSEMRLETNENEGQPVVNPTGCVDANGNTLAGGAAGVISLFEQNGSLNIEQASAAALSAANGGATVTIGAGTPSFGVACSTPPPAPLFPDSGFGQAPAGPRAKVPVDTASSAGAGVTASPLVAPRAAPAPKASAPKVAAPRAAAPAPKALKLAAKRDGGGTFRFAAADTSAPLNPAPQPAPEPVAQRRKVSAPVLTAPRPDAAGETVSVNIGTLPANDSVTITFQVTIANPYSGPANIENQGDVTGTNFSPVKTDDPDTAAPNDKTLTPVNSLKISINDAQVAEPVAPNTTDMTFTVALSQPASGAVDVTFTTANGTATAGSCGDPGADYTATSGTVSFTAGQQVKTINVPICSDDVADDGETLLVNLTGTTSGTIIDSQATGTITANTPGTILISELRTSGPGSPNNDFVEVYNNSDSPHTVNSADDTGYGIFRMGTGCDATPVLIATIPEGTVIPPRGHYLKVGTAYSLANYGGTGAAAGDGPAFTTDLGSDNNVGVFSTADVVAISSVNRLDAVGFGLNTGGACNLLREGSTLPAQVGSAKEHTFFRKMCDFVGGTGCLAGGNPKDSNANSADFQYADTAPDMSGTQKLGAPGPENLASPIRRDNTGAIGFALLDSTKPASAVPNRERTLGPGPAATSTFGTLIIRRRVTNTTANPINRLRFRIIELTTYPSPAGTADLRAVTSTGDESISQINDPATCTASGAGSPLCTVTVKPTTLETPPAQPNGGGFNSTFSAGTISLGSQLASGASINLRFVLGIQQTGTFRFYIIVEALP